MTTITSTRRATHKIRITKVNRLSKTVSEVERRFTVNNIEARPQNRLRFRDIEWKGYPLLIAHHLIWTAYGWWLPNDPRGSTSRCIRNDVITELGQIHYGRKKSQPSSGEIRDFFDKTDEVLQYPLLEFAPAEIEAIGVSFAEVSTDRKYTCYACAIMPDHVHILIRKHKDKAEEMIANLQEASIRNLRENGFRTADHPVWGGPGWKVFLDHPDGVRRTIEYIRNNPVKLHLPLQHWGFVKEYDGWPLHPGHSPNSPYARTKRGQPFSRNRKRFHRE